jgi:hypothetical protein
MDALSCFVVTSLSWPTLMHRTAVLWKLLLHLCSECMLYVMSNGTQCKLHLAEWS